MAQETSYLCLSQYQPGSLGPKDDSSPHKSGQKSGGGVPRTLPNPVQAKWELEAQSLWPLVPYCLLPRFRTCAPPSVGSTAHIPTRLQRAFESQSTSWPWAFSQRLAWELLGSTWHGLVRRYSLKGPMGGFAPSGGRPAFWEKRVLPGPQSVKRSMGGSGPGWRHLSANQWPS